MGNTSFLYQTTSSPLVPKKDTTAGRLCLWPNWIMFQGRSLDTIDEMHKSLLFFYTINTKTQLRQADATEKTPLDF